MSVGSIDSSFHASSYPQVSVRTVEGQGGRKDRGLFAASAFEPGQLILKESPILHTSHPIARAFIPTADLDIPHDWQRLLFLYATHRRSNQLSQVLDGIIVDLSMDGVCSDLAREADPDRESEFQEWAQEWISWYHQQGGSDGTSWQPTAEEIFRLIAILETNSHSRDEDDMRDLLDPRTGVVPTNTSDTMDMAMTMSASTDEHEDDETKDEACGLWIMASMLNHSCLPNCTVFIPPTKRTGDEAALYLRCIRPVSAGEELLINYHDEEYLPTLDRQDILRSRGFDCQCPLCSGRVREYMRSAACSNLGCIGGQGVCCPVRANGEIRWICDHCGGALDALAISAVEAKEQEWMGQWEQILAMTIGDIPAEQCTHLLAYQVLQQLSRSWAVSLPANGGSITPPFLPFLSPLHVTHSHVYSFLKYILFEQSFWLRQQFGDDGVHAVLLCMLAVIERALSSLGDGGLSLNVSEERRVLGYWLVKEAQRRLEQAEFRGEEEVNRWRDLQDQGLLRWEVGMQYLCSRD